MSTKEMLYTVGLVIVALAVWRLLGLDSKIPQVI
jgi:hypothetical protein